MVKEHVRLGGCYLVGGVCLVIGAVALSPPVWAREPIGATRCGTCHIAEFEDWRVSAHARSLASLTKEQQKDPTCRSCHTLAPNSDDEGLAGVQCESCHGIGTYYAPTHVMRDRQLAQLLGLQTISAATCRGCHSGVDARLKPIDYRKMIESVSHKLKDSEQPNLPVRRSSFRKLQ
ncbi:MAG: cytochrome c family protein [Myxococcales bacterium]|nr:cytochrome c family protein [Myxococcales bacterium]